MKSGYSILFHPISCYKKVKRYWFIIWFGLFCPPVSWQIPVFYYEFPDFIQISFLCILFSAITCVQASGGLLYPSSACSAHCMIYKGKEMRGQVGNKTILRRCARNYSGVQLIAPIPDSNPIPSLTEEIIYMDHMVVLSCDRDCDTTVKLALHVQDGNCSHFFVECISTYLKTQWQKLSNSSFLL